MTESADHPAKIAPRFRSVHAFVWFALLASVARYAVGATAVPWDNADIGEVGVAGGSQSTGSGFIVSAGGADIWGGQDAFHFVYQPWDGDGEIVAKVASVDGGGWAKAGLMFRQTLEPGSGNVFLFITPVNGTGLQIRNAANGNTEYELTSWNTPPSWLKLARVGAVFQAYTSVDGTNWSIAGWVNATMPSNLQVGLAFTSHNAAGAATAVFDGPQVSKRLSVPAAPVGLSATPYGPESVQLFWGQGNPAGTGYELQRTTNPDEFLAAGAGPTSKTLPAGALEDRETFLLSDTTHYFRLRSLGPAGPSPWSEAASAKTLKLPSPWQNRDIGNSPTPGDAKFLWYSTGADYELNGAGTGTAGAQDGIQYLYIPWTGEGEIIVHMWGIQGGNELSSAGLMFRQSLEAVSPFAGIFVSAGGNTAMQSRGALHDSTRAQPGVALDSAWLRLARTNNTFTAYQAQFGYDYKETPWVFAGQVTVEMTDPVYVGLAVASPGGIAAKAFFYSTQLRFGSDASILPMVRGPMRAPGGQLQFELFGESGRMYEVLTSTNLVDWLSMGFQSSPAGVIQFQDYPSAAQSRRFYRAIRAD